MHSVDVGTAGVLRGEDLGKLKVARRSNMHEKMFIC